MQNKGEFEKKFTFLCVYCVKTKWIIGGKNQNSYLFYRCFEEKLNASIFLSTCLTFSPDNLKNTIQR